MIASGGVSSLSDVRTLRKLGVNAVIVGKALYTGALKLEDALVEARYGQLFDAQTLVPAIIQHAETKAVLMLGYMSRESLALTVKTGRATFFSRSRNQLWVKGETSGNFLDVVSLSIDCDDDTLLLQCRPHGPTCHTGRDSCFTDAIPIWEGERHG